jgi:hypothetical protein
MNAWVKKNTCVWKWKMAVPWLVILTELLRQEDKNISLSVFWLRKLTSTLFLLQAFKGLCHFTKIRLTENHFTEMVMDRIVIRPKQSFDRNVIWPKWSFDRKPFDRKTFNWKPLYRNGHLTKNHLIEMVIWPNGHLIEMVICLKWSLDRNGYLTECSFDLKSFDR